MTARRTTAPLPACALLVLGLLAAGPLAADAPAADPAGAAPAPFPALATNRASLIGSVLSPVQRAPKPDRFDTFQQRLDYVHDNLYNDYNTRAERTDAYFGRSLVEPEQAVPSRFRAGLFLEVSQEDTTQFAFQPSFEARIRLPNVEKRWNVFLNTQRPGALPGADPTAVDNSLRLGLSTFLRHLPVSARAGLRISWIPEAFTELAWGPEWTWASWFLLPSQKAFFETDDKFGEQTQVAAYRWFGPGQRWLAGGLTAATWSQATDGLEWEATLKAVYVRALLDERDRGHDIGSDDLARGLSARYTLFGSDRCSTEHRAMLTWRRPVHREWIYVEITPGIKWDRTRGWRPDPLLLVGLDFLFWGAPAR